ncbi:hypothetical protein ACFSUK_06400 [Sphingobium scionense]|uniref:Uncharacterized protein n=1 Tax=Sphingobium scionense TaxID=1404341 RepID=A0A7W6LN62_9SPHN|nr:hypothetical protein [Sphingobium scionense]MBB4147444.1 hypothetical protein [Sphingobium scionense]
MPDRVRHDEGGLHFVMIFSVLLLAAGGQLLNLRDEWKSCVTQTAIELSRRNVGPAITVEIAEIECRDKFDRWVVAEIADANLMNGIEPDEAKYMAASYVALEASAYRKSVEEKILEQRAASK